MQYRQGDVLIERIMSEELPEGHPTQERLLVRGEGRFHGHFLVGDAVEVLENPRFGAEDTVSHFLEVKEDAVLKHLHTETHQPTREHEDIPLEPGRYRVIRQREYNPYARAIQILRD